MSRSRVTGRSWTAGSALVSVMVVATVLTVVSGWDYLRGTLPLLLGQRG